MDILEELRHVNNAPKAMREAEQNLNYLKQVIANSADEIERLRKENVDLRKILKGE